MWQQMRSLFGRSLWMLMIYAQSVAQWRYRSGSFPVHTRLAGEYHVRQKWLVRLYFCVRLIWICFNCTLCFCFPTKISHLLILHFSYLNARSPAKKCISGMRPYGNNLYKFIDPLHGCIKVKKTVFEFLVFVVIFFVKNFNFHFLRKKGIREIPSKYTNNVRC